MFEFTIPAILSFMAMSSMLVIYGTRDIHSQIIPNRMILVGGTIGTLLVIFSGHFMQHILLHLISVIFVLFLGYALFQIGAFGGADVKVVMIVAIVSPGLEFATWDNPLIEGVVVAGVQLLVMLVGGHVYSRVRKTMKEGNSIPLIPFLLGAYLSLQLLAIF